MTSPSSGAHLPLDLTHVEIEVPNYGVLREERMNRNRETMQAVDKGISKDILPEVDLTSAETGAAVCIQRHFRGHQGRKVYVEKLYTKYEEEERERTERIHRQMEEGELLVDNVHLKVSLGDGQTVRRNRGRYYASQVITIQRAWRAFRRRRSSSAAEGT
ncbi:uncharacterized protein LOC101850726, partial [Aplysia californica]|uniref:Uncharacterized protein LOC101850726 n=1 Tax=Aplysia californica TaxID=6500 RepID=A0ABM1A1I0_APLCA